MLEQNEKISDAVAIFTHSLAKYKHFTAIITDAILIPRVYSILACYCLAS